MLGQVGSQLATVSWQQPSVGKNNNDTRANTPSCVS